MICGMIIRNVKAESEWTAAADRRQVGSMLEKIIRPLTEWYQDNKRILPWRADRNPYYIWVSEIMLQQTRVEAVKPYFKNFISELPTVRELAACPEDRLLKLWEGLGYYNRVRNMQKAAVTIVNEYGGKLPADYEALKKLSGIGSYTAGAIASIAFNQPLPAVDGNVLRVISRILGDREDIKKASVKTGMEQELKAVMPADEASHYNQGLIEIGALVCIPGGEPKCSECPLASVCLTKKNGWWKEIPYKSPAKARKIEKRTVFIIEYQDKVAIHKRPPKGLLAALYELPNVLGYPGSEEVPEVLGLEPEAVEQLIPLPSAKHVFSHVEWHMSGYRVVLRQKEDGAGWDFAEGPEAVRDPALAREPALAQEPASVQKQDRAGDWFMVSRKEVEEKYALPNAFQAYTSLIG